MKAMRQLVWMGVVLGGLLVRLAGQAPAAREPHLGYVFPAGGQRATTVEVIIAGQFLQNPSRVVVSGDGVTARVIKFYRKTPNLDNAQRQEIQRCVIARRAVLAGKPVPPVKPRAADAPPLVMPDMIFLDRLKTADLAELEHLMVMFRRTEKKQLNTQIGEMVTVALTIDAAAVPGVRELRLLTANGLTNPLRFEVGTCAETFEREPNDPNPGAVSLAKTAELPVVFNGQALPGDVDRLRFHARRGQNLVVEVQARSLIPYLADAVPGWFQPVLAVLDAKGKELAYADDFRFRPDPVLLVRVPEDGDYALEIHDSIFRGREDFVYRIKVSEQPFVTACFPLGAAVGSTAPARLTGWNLPPAEVVLDTRAGGATLREFSVSGHDSVSNPVAYAVDDLPDAGEGEPNNTRDQAHALPWPCVVNGRIDQPGDLDLFRLAAPAGAAVVMEVWARRLGSPVDSVVRVTDAAGKVLAWNDDSMIKDGDLQLGDGLLTHHADSRLSWSMPATGGPFFVQIEDAQHQGGVAFGYRLRVSPARPDFALRVTPSVWNLIPGRSLPVTLHVDRRDGFEGPVSVTLAGAAAGWTLSGNVIPPGHERLRMTVTAPMKASPGVAAVQLVGKADVAGVAVTREAQACDDTMQAFLWRHLVPARECLASLPSGKPYYPLVTRISEGQVTIPAGGETVMRFRVPVWVVQKGVDVVPLEVPDGLATRTEMKLPDEIKVYLTADAAKLKPGYADNLIFGAVLKDAPTAKDSKKATSKRNGAAAVVVMPAVAMTILPPNPKP